MEAQEAIAQTTWIGANISFWVITLMVLVSAFYAAFSRSIVRAAYSLFFTLFGMAGYYVLLGSGFLAVTQIIIYVGGILVLLMFGVLLTNRPLTPTQQQEGRRYTLATIVGGLLLVFVLAKIITTTEWHIVPLLVEPASSVRALGEMLLGNYLLVLEVSGMTLLLCLVGAAYLVRRQEH